MTLNKADYQTVIQVGVIQAKGYENWIAKFNASREGMKLEFGKKELQYQVSASGQVQDKGKTARLSLQWTEVSIDLLGSCNL